MGAVQGSMLLVCALIAIVLLIVMIARYKIYPFLVLIIVSLGLGLVVGIPMDKIVKSFETGNGNTLDHIAIVVELGTILGKMMAESGGAERIAVALIGWFGEKNIHWAMMFVAIIIGLPVFFEVGFVLLIPIAFNVAKRTGKSLLLVGLPMVAGLSVVHGLIPPHPAALLAVQQYGGRHRQDHRLRPDRRDSHRDHRRPAVRAGDPQVRQAAGEQPAGRAVHRFGRQGQA